MGAVGAALELIKRHPEMIKELSDKADYFRRELNKLGFDTLESKTQIVPLLIGDEQKSMEFADELYRNGVFAPAIRWPAVPKGLGRIRFAISLPHSYEQINNAIGVIFSAGKKLKVVS